ncbi:MAG: hypothetical protein J6V13_04305 [Paludibacteraceae bacterium]|nr:hypothetical protein [Paludibacteraceae bacterium]
MSKRKIKIGLVDADLLCNGTRHPNLALLKIAGYFRDNGYVRGYTDDANCYELITNESNFDELRKYSYFYVSCVFTFTIDNPPLVLTTLLNDKKLSKRVRMGGTGTYANLSIEEGFAEKREEDMFKLENDAFLNTLKNKSGSHGIDMQIQMPDYHLYDDFINVMENVKSSGVYYKDYKDYSIGFLTRGCFRRCPFCVNKLERKVMPYSKLSDFLDNEIDEQTGKLKRPYIYLWDDNFLASPYWEPLLDELIATKRPFQFRQGLDERLIAQHKRGEEMAKKLANANYHGDFIFAFDNWFDRKVIEKALKIWKYYCPKKETKFYLFCGFQQSEIDYKKFQLDVAEIFMRICVLMRYGCLPYIMRHEDYKKAPLPNIYVQIARWCNQPGFFRNLSFWQFCYKNQTFWEEHTLGRESSKLKTYEEFLEDYNNGYYDEIGISTPLRTAVDFLNQFKEHKDLFLSFFNMSFKQMIDSNLWYRDTEIMFGGIKYILNNEFWENLIGNSENERALLKVYYTHKDLSLLEDEKKSALLLEILKKHSCSEILQIIEEGFEPAKIDKKDISQFSDFKDAYYTVPFILQNCGAKDVDYSKMGYMLRDEKRKDVADKKYGENHMKTAAQLGLCRFESCRGNANTLGNCFIKLSEADRKNILPKLCLYIPYIQNYFMAGATDEVRDEILSILSHTTQVRRRSNVNTIIHTIKESIDYEL